VARQTHQRIGGGEQLHLVQLGPGSDLVYAVNDFVGELNAVRV
jgi:hypothetical protein